MYCSKNIGKLKINARNALASGNSSIESAKTHCKYLDIAKQCVVTIHFGLFGLLSALLCLGRFWRRQDLFIFAHVLSLICWWDFLFNPVDVCFTVPARFLFLVRALLFSGT